ncbi:MAG TPA: sigma-54 dependent transcriptional regulator [Candidatus Acidoferrum sp.]|nr:sigma-54 dependent transcriptional regulator [Candidatus Acidoferrum sp.]
MAELRGRILIVDDETNARTALAELLRYEGYSVETAMDGFKALPKLEEFAPHLLLTDLKMPGMDGLDLMRRVREIDPETAILVMTAHAAVDTAVAAMRQGATSYLTKPINIEELVIVIDQALERQRLRREAGQLRARLSEQHRLEGIVGSTPPMQKLFETVLQVAPSRASVLITGESGTGKELVAAAIHEHSPRASGPFIKLHCGALAETLLESELFGHERGSFTGAAGKRDGRFQQADGGTLFLDEIGEISPSVQVKLLRFLQEREFERVGGNQTIKVDVRIIAATNRDLMQRVTEGRFREDLFYRLNVVCIEVPPLRYRASDIPLLAMHFLRKYAGEDGKAVTGFTDEALERITHHAWPGNVRELENAIERAVVVCRGSEIRETDLPASVLAGAVATRDGMPAVPGATLAELERFAILRTLEHTGGSTSRAAEILGISPRKIQYRLHEYSGVPTLRGGNDLEDDTDSGS